MYFRNRHRLESWKAWDCFAVYYNRFFKMKIMESDFDKHTVTTRQAAACLRLLKDAGRFLTAAEIGAALRLGGGRETQRRHVRAIVGSLRDRGEWIAAQNPAGYLWTDDPAVWRDYQEGRKIDAKKMIGEAARRQRMVVTPAGQGLLFC